MNFNFEGTDLASICSLTPERSIKVADKMAHIAHAIELDYLDYSFDEKDENEQSRLCVHKGKILNRFFDEITDENERIFVVMLFETVIDILIAQVQKKRFAEEIKKSMASFLNENL